MVTGATSQSGHETTPLRKPSTRTVAQRRVYGKRRNNAPRAMFDPKSPARTPKPSQEPNDPVEAIQAKLAEVSLNEKPVVVEEPVAVEEPLVVEEPVVVQEVDKAAASTTEPDSAQAQKVDPESKPHDKPATPPSPPRSAHPTPKKSPPKAKLAKKKTYQTLLEVRICTKPVEKPAALKMEKESSSSTGAQTPRKRAPKPRMSPGYVHDSKANDYVRPILKEARSSISSESIQRFDTWASRSATMFHVAKLAEGSYGEVYKLHLHEEGNRPAVSKSKLAKLRAYGDGVFKVVPLRAQSGPGSKKFTTIDEIASEVKMLKHLDPIPGFARFREIHVVQGRFPETFQTAWDHYKKTKDDCLNPNPASKKAYPDTQLWAIIEMDDAGCELEKFAWSSVFQIYDIFWGVAMALARAEEYALFEHRDLHLGNVCIRSTRANGSMESPTDMEIARQTSPSGFGTSSLETTIIDYSLSRADLRLGDLPDDPAGIIENASSDLDKKQIFDAIGQDEDEVLLRDTYRFMRATLYTGNPLETAKTADIPGIWAEYAPRTNLVWLLFILKNLMKNRKPEAAQRASTPAATPQRKALAPCSPNKTIERQSAKNETQYSADSLVKERQTKDLQARIGQVKKTLEDRLNAVLGLLDLEHGHEDMCCAADLVAYAMDSQWLAQQDFF